MRLPPSCLLPVRLDRVPALLDARMYLHPRGCLVRGRAPVAHVASCSPEKHACANAEDARDVLHAGSSDVKANNDSKANGDGPVLSEVSTARHVCLPACAPCDDKHKCSTRSASLHCFVPNRDVGVP